jgi:N-acetylglucosaminyl-diphospho-decaprenol L-rhamnosyltransferase
MGTMRATGADSTPASHPRHSVGPPDVSIVIVSFNTRELLRKALSSVEAGTGDLAAEVIVVDNASVDGSQEMVRREFPAVRLIANRDNLGFGAANNQAFATARGRWLLLLNSDAELVGDALPSALNFARSEKNVGAVGCRARYPTGVQQSTVFRVPGLLQIAITVFAPNSVVRRSRLLGRSRYVGADLDRPMDVEVVAGCFMLVPRVVFEEVGGFDPEFFVYGEEAEWCHRIRQSGRRVIYWPGATITHHARQSARQVADRMILTMARGQLLVIRKTRGRLIAYVANLLMFVRDAPRAGLWYLLGIGGGRRGVALRERLRPAAARTSFHGRRLLRVDVCR